MEELVALVNKRDEMIETIELERQRVEKESESNNNSSTMNTQSPAKGIVRVSVRLNENIHHGKSIDMF